MADMRVNIAGVEFSNPVITASGTYGFGREYSNFFSLSELGGISCKGITLEERQGNPPPRIAETPSGILNSVGLQNPGVDYFIEHDLPWLKSCDTVIIANIAGRTMEDYCTVAEKLDATDVDMIELNISCPNVKAGGVAFGVTPQGVEEITGAVRAATGKPLIVKLTPNTADISATAKAAENSGADAVSLINTITGMKIDINTRRPVLRNNTGGLSGAAVLPIAVRMVWQAANAVKIPVIGMGGVCRWQDAVELMLAGACAVQIGTANFTDVYTPLKVRDGIEKYLDNEGFKSVSEIVGKVEVWE